MNCPRLFGFLWRQHQWRIVTVRPRVYSGVMVVQECARCQATVERGDWGGW